MEWPPTGDLRVSVASKDYLTHWVARVYQGKPFSLGIRDFTVRKGYNNG